MTTLTGGQYDLLCHTEAFQVTRADDGRWVIDVTDDAKALLAAGYAYVTTDPSGHDYLCQTGHGTDAVDRFEADDAPDRPAPAVESVGFGWSQFAHDVRTRPWTTVLHLFAASVMVAVGVVGLLTLLEPVGR